MILHALAVILVLDCSRECVINALLELSAQETHILATVVEMELFRLLDHVLAFRVRLIVKLVQVCLPV